MNVEPLDVHFFLFSRQLDAVWLDPGTCQRSLQSEVLNLELSTTGVLEDRAPQLCLSGHPGTNTEGGWEAESLHILEPCSFLDAGTIQDGV